MKGRSKRLGLAGTLIAVLGTSPLAGPANAAIDIKLRNGPSIAKFDELACKVSRSGKEFAARAKKPVRGWTLSVRIDSFSGFKKYEIEYGDNSPADFFFFRPPLRGSPFTNIIDPSPGGPLPDLTLGGGVAFSRSKKGRSLALSFPITYDDPPSEDWVNVRGKAACV